MTIKRLTEISVASINAPLSGRKEYRDAIIPGLNLRITEKGTKTWSVITRVEGDPSINGRGRRQHRISLGRYPRVSLKLAREKAREVLEQAELGELQTKKALIDNNREQTVNELIDSYRTHLNLRTAHSGKPNKKWASGKVDLILKKHFLWRCGDNLIKEFSRSHARSVLRNIETENQHSHTIAKEVLKIVRPIFRWAVEEDMITDNPFDYIRMPPDRTRDRVLAQEELSAVWKAASDYAYPFGDFIKLLILTAQRRSEIACLKWEWIHLTDQIPHILIPREHYKTGKSQVVPLSSLAISILESLPRFKGPYVFSSCAGQKPISGYSKAKAEIDDKLQEVITEPWTYHDLRRTVATALPRLGFNSDISERVLGHSIPGVRRIYDRYDYLPEKHQALEAWSAEIIRITGGKR